VKVPTATRVQVIDNARFAIRGAFFALISAAVTAHSIIRFIVISTSKYSARGRTQSAVFAISLGLLGLAAAAAPAHATLLFTGSGTAAGNSVSASAEFIISGNTLTVTLQNTSGANALESPGSTLTGFSFLLGGGSPTLTTVSAISPNTIVNAGDCNASSCGGTNVNVGGEWGYQSSFSNGTLGVSGVEGIGSSGYITTGLPHDLGNFNGPDLQSPASLDGIEFGVISANHGALNGGLTGQALIDDTVILTLSGVSGFSESQITDVTFFYGTPDSGLTGVPDVPGVPVPEPPSGALFAIGLLGLGLLRARRAR
jgi:hypothetical protein